MTLSPYEEMVLLLPQALRKEVDYRDGFVYASWDGTNIGHMDATGRLALYDGRVVQGLAAALYITKRAMIEQIMPVLPNVLEGVYVHNLRRGWVAIKGSGLGPFLNLNGPGGLGRALQDGLEELSFQTARLVSTELWKRLYGQRGVAVQDADNGATVTISSNEGTARVIPVVDTGRVLVHVDTAREKGSHTLAPGDGIPAWIVRALCRNGGEEEKTE